MAQKMSSRVTFSITPPHPEWNSTPNQKLKLHGKMASIFSKKNVS